MTPFRFSLKLLRTKDMKSIVNFSIIPFFFFFSNVMCQSFSYQIYSAAREGRSGTEMLYCQDGGYWLMLLKNKSGFQYYTLVDIDENQTFLFFEGNPKILYLNENQLQTTYRKDPEKFTLEYFPDSTKTIRNFHCSLVKIKEEGANKEINVWITDELDVAPVHLLVFQYPGLKGFPILIEYEDGYEKFSAFGSETDYYYLMKEIQNKIREGTSQNMEEAVKKAGYDSLEDLKETLKKLVNQ